VLSNKEADQTLLQSPLKMCVHNHDCIMLER